jgi:hypothetical protein
MGNLLVAVMVAFTFCSPGCAEPTATPVKPETRARRANSWTRASKTTRICLNGAQLHHGHSAQRAVLPGRLHFGSGPASTPFCRPSFAAASFM